MTTVSANSSVGSMIDSVFRGNSTFLPNNPFNPIARRTHPGLTAALSSAAAKRESVMSERDQYVLGYRRAEQERLQQQAQQLAHESNLLFDQIGVHPGARVVEIGCGPHGCLEILAERVGSSGSVVGVERSQDAVDLARK